MGSACSSLKGRVTAVASRQQTAQPAPRRRLTQPQECVDRKDGVREPPSLMTLAVQCICRDLERHPRLNLPTELAQRVFAELKARTWLDKDALMRLQECELLKVELANFAQLGVRRSRSCHPAPFHAPHPTATQDDWIAVLAKQQQLVRLDVSGARRLSDAGLAPLPKLRLLGTAPSAGPDTLTTRPALCPPSRSARPGSRLPW